MQFNEEPEELNDPSVFRLIILICNFLLERRSSSSQAIHNFCVITLSFLKRKRIDRARVDNKVDSQMFMLPVI